MLFSGQCCVRAPSGPRPQGAASRPLALSHVQAPTPRRATAWPIAATRRRRHSARRGSGALDGAPGREPASVRFPQKNRRDMLKMSISAHDPLRTIRLHRVVWISLRRASMPLRFRARAAGRILNLSTSVIHLSTISHRNYGWEDRLGVFCQLC